MAILTRETAEQFAIGAVAIGVAAAVMAAPYWFKEADINSVRLPAVVARNCLERNFAKNNVAVLDHGYSRDGHLRIKNVWVEGEIKVPKSKEFRNGLMRISVSREVDTGLNRVVAVKTPKSAEAAKSLADFRASVMSSCRICPFVMQPGEVFLLGKERADAARKHDAPKRKASAVPKAAVQGVKPN